MERADLTMRVLPGTYAIAQLPAGATVPEWAQGSFISLTRTLDELSVVCPEQSVPPGVTAQREMALLKVDGPLDFALTGIVSRIAATLAERGVSIFPIATYDTDYVLVPNHSLDKSIAALRAAGIRVERD